MHSSSHAQQQQQRQWYPAQRTGAMDSHKQSPPCSSSSRVQSQEFGSSAWLLQPLVVCLNQQLLPMSVGTRIQASNLTAGLC